MLESTHRLALAMTALATIGIAPIAVAAPPAIDREQLRFAVNLSEAFKSVTRTVSPSVVHIVAIDEIDESEREATERFWPFGSDRMPEERPMGQGSGVIVSSDGYVVTNNHVIRGADHLHLRLKDGREFEAEVIGVDRETDLAVIKIEAEDLEPIAFGDTGSLEPGEWVLALGNPFGLSHSVTAGIVSAVGRREMGLATYENFIQTDATINPGNSGGPLVNLYGEMVGVNTAISTRNGVSNGVGFAIPANMVRDVFERIVENGRVVRGWLGVHMVDLTEDMAESIGYEGDGVVLVPVSDRPSPARKAGVQRFDVLTHINGHAIRSRSDLLDVVAAIEPGATASLEIIRSDGLQTIDVVVGERPDNLR